MADKRYVGGYPEIRLRLIVDGIRSPMRFRERLEEQVWAMAKTAKKFFEENLFYSNGDLVKVTITITAPVDGQGLLYDSKCG